MATNRTPTGAKATRCKATEGAQQCLKEQHAKTLNHTWGKRGATGQWNADGTPKVAADATDQLPAVEEWACPAEVKDSETGVLHRCDRHDEHDPDPLAQGHYWRAVSGPGVDQFGTDPDTGTYHPAPDPDGPWPDAFNGDNADPAEAQREEQRADAAAQRRAEIAAAVTDTDRADMQRIEASHPDIIRANGPRPVSVSGAPGSRLADVTSLVSTWTQLGFPVELQDELTQIQIAKLALDSMLEEIIRTRQPSDPALVASLVDAVDHIARARGLVRGGGSA